MTDTLRALALLEAENRLLRQERDQQQARADEWKEDSFAAEELVQELRAQLRLVGRWPSELHGLVSGQLRSCIDAHGPITKELIGSAAKRVVKQLLATSAAATSDGHLGTQGETPLTREQRVERIKRQTQEACASLEQSERGIRIEAHASLVQEMETYLQHKADCAIGAGREYRAGNGHTCTCGLSALLRRSAAPGTTETET